MALQDGTIGRRYARALVLALGDEASDADFRKVDDELSALSALMQQRTGNTDFRQLMRNPNFPAVERLAILESIGKENGFADTTNRVLRLLVVKDRIRYLPQIASAFSGQVDERSGRVRAQITSARVLDDEQVKEIVNTLEKKTGKTVVPELEVEPEIIGGVSARVGGVIFDNSVKSQLERMRHAFSG